VSSDDLITKIEKARSQMHVQPVKIDWMMLRGKTYHNREIIMTEEVIDTSLAPAKAAERAAEQYIGSFNPNDRDDVAQIKTQAKDLIVTIHMLDTVDHRRRAMACTHIEQGAMMAVKSLFS
jgi:hypothetical protein